MSAPRRSIETALKLVAETYYGDEGAWLYQAFDAINKKLFFGELPYPLITIEITPHSGCLAWCSSSTQGRQSDEP